MILAFQDTANGINLWRLIGGIGIGVELVTIDSYISELVPKSSRGKAFAFQQGVGFLAVPLVALLAWLLVPQTVAGLSGWRWVVIFGSLGALVIWVLRRQLPESPRCSPASSSAPSPAPSSLTSSAGARSSPTRCCGTARAR